jgi:predicted transcriptional regulator
MIHVESNLPHSFSATEFDCRVRPELDDFPSLPRRLGGHFEMRHRTRPTLVGLISRQIRHLSASSRNMAKKTLPPLSAAEQALMDVLWKKHPASVLEMLEAVNLGRSEPVTRNTLQTQLTRLEAKGWIKRDDSSRSHAYEPAVPEQRGRTSVLTDLKQRLFGGSGLALVRCLVESGEISEEELAELRKLVRSKKGGAES